MVLCCVPRSLTIIVNFLFVKVNWCVMIAITLPRFFVFATGTATLSQRFNTLRPRQNGRHFADDILKCIFLNENVWISIKISLKFAPKCPINNIPALVQIMAWRRPGDKPLSEPVMVRLSTHICVTRPQWFRKSMQNINSFYWNRIWNIQLHDSIFIFYV